MFDARIFGELLLEFGHFGPENILAAFNDAVDGIGEAVAQTGALRAKIDKLHAKKILNPFASLTRRGATPKALQQVATMRPYTWP